MYAQLRRAQHARNQRREDNRRDEPRSDLDTFRPLENVQDGRIDEYECDEAVCGLVAATMTRVQRDGDSGGCHQDKYASCVGTSLRVDVRVEQYGDQEGNAGK